MIADMKAKGDALVMEGLGVGVGVGVDEVKYMRSEKDIKDQIKMLDTFIKGNEVELKHMSLGLIDKLFIERLVNERRAARDALRWVLEHKGVMEPS